MRKSEYTGYFESIRLKNVTIARFVEFLQSLLFLPFRWHFGDKSGAEGDEGLVKERIDELISIELPSLDTRNNCHCNNNSTGYIPIVTRFDCYLTNEIRIKKESWSRLELIRPKRGQKGCVNRRYK